MNFEEKIVIENVDFRIYKNVESQTCNIHTSELFYTYYNSELDLENIQYFLLFETCFDAAFAHWIYESAMFLPYYQELKQTYPKLKMLVKRNPKRKYKKLIFNAFNIVDDDIFWVDNIDKFSSTIVYENIPINNVCINCPNPYMNTLPIKNYDFSKKLIINFKDKLLNNLDIEYPLEKSIENLFLPRSKNGENYQPNERQINYSQVYNLLKAKEYKEYDTVNTENFKDQIELLLSSKNIFIDWGSSLLVNLLFCTNSSIYVSGVIQSQIDAGYAPYPILCEINNNNSIHFLSH